MAFMDSRPPSGSLGPSPRLLLHPRPVPSLRSSTPPAASIGAAQKMAALRYCLHRLRSAAVRFHCGICMSGASQRGRRMAGAPADPQSCCHPSSPRSSSRMVRSPSNRGPGFAARGPEAIGKSIDTPRPSLASWLNPPPPSSSLPLSLVMAK